MSDLIQEVKDGKVVNASTTTSKKTESNNSLGKDAFLQLLVTQMKYQDPLNPSSNTEYVAQLATFSQLEQLQNLSDASTTSQALSLVGKTVDITTQSASGSTSVITGRVDYVTMSNGNVQLSINGKLYSYEQLSTVIDSTYLLEQGLPTVSQTALKYDASNPKDQSITVSLGSGETIADDVAVVINDAVLHTDLVKVEGDKVIIDKLAFSSLKNGSYKITIQFNDSLYTTVKDKVTLEVINSNVTEANSSSTEAVTT